MEVKPLRQGSVPAGYEQAEIGVIPKDWKVVPVSALGETKRGASSLCIRYRSSGGVRLIRINDFFQDNPVFVEPTDEIMKYSIHERDLLFAGTGASAGASYLPKKEWIGLPHSYNAPRIRVFESSCKKYLLYSLRSDYVLKQQRAWFVGNAQPFLDTKAISSFSIAVPPTRPEQEAIAEVLSDADALIESLEQLLAKKRQLKQGAMQELLTGRKRLPRFNGKWKMKRIADLAKLSKSGVNPGSTPNAFFTHFSLPAFDAGAVPVVEHGGLIGSNKFLVPPDAVLLSKLNPRIPRVWAPSDIPTNAVCSTEFLVLVPREDTDRDFLAAICRSPTVSYQMELHAIGTTGSHQRINPLQALAIEVTAPEDIAEQAAIAAILSDMDAEIAELEAKLAKARQLKQGMMQELLTGRIRLVRPSKSGGNPQC